MSGFRGRNHHGRLGYVPTIEMGEDEARKAVETSQRNARSRSAGDVFQRLLDLYHAELEATGMAAKVLRTNPDIIVTGPGKARVTGKGPVDYVAFLMDGRTVHFDAKTRGEEAYSIDKKDWHQVEWLDTLAKRGDPVGLLVYWHEYNDCRWHPRRSFQQRVRRADGYPCEGFRWLETVTKHG